MELITSLILMSLLLAVNTTACGDRTLRVTRVSYLGFVTYRNLEAVIIEEYRNSSMVEHITSIATTNSKLMTRV
jgi:hypothetical protein